MGYLEDISERIRLIKKYLANDNNCEFSRITGESEAKIRSYIRTNKKPAMPSAEFIAKVIEKFELNYEWMLYGKGEMKNTYPPKVEKHINLVAEEDSETYKVRTHILPDNEYQNMKRQIDELIKTNLNLSELLNKKNTAEGV